jgi:hypothetical protein
MDPPNDARVHDVYIVDGLVRLNTYNLYDAGLLRWGY